MICQTAKTNDEFDWQHYSLDYNVIKYNTPVIYCRCHSHCEDKVLFYSKVLNFNIALT